MIRILVQEFLLYNKIYHIIYVSIVDLFSETSRSRELSAYLYIIQGPCSNRKDLVQSDIVVLSYRALCTCTVCSTVLYVAQLAPRNKLQVFVVTGTSTSTSTCNLGDDGDVQVKTKTNVFVFLFMLCDILSIF